MKIAFDWQGTLDVHEELRAMAKSLQKAEWEVLILSAMPINLPDYREKEIEAAQLGIPYKVVYHQLEDYHKSAALAKVAVMKEQNIPILVDDTFEVCKVVRDNGLKALKI